MPMIKHILSFFLLMNLLCAVFAQKSDAKDYIISGNQLYGQGDFAKAEAQYKSALSKDPNSIKANYNLGNALYKQKRMEESRVHYDRVIHDKNATKADQHKAYHNIGKSYLDENNPEKAVANLKEALKLNPYDEETRYNYALARKLLEKQEEKNDQKDQQNQDNQDNKNNSEENKNDSQENREKQDEGDKGEQNENQKPQNQNGNQEGGENEDKEGKGETPQNSQITKGEDGKGKNSSQPLNSERQEGLLEALRQQEQETLKKIISQKAQKVRVNTEKDW